MKQTRMSKATLGFLGPLTSPTLPCLRRLPKPMRVPKRSSSNPPAIDSRRCFFTLESTSCGSRQELADNRGDGERQQQHSQRPAATCCLQAL